MAARVRTLELSLFGVAVIAAALVVAAPARPQTAATAAPPVAPAAPLSALDDVLATALAAQPETTAAPRVTLRARRRGALSPDLLDRCLEVARDVAPAVADSLEQIRRDRSQAEFELAIRNARNLVGLAKLKQEDARLYDVKMQQLRLEARVDEALAAVVQGRRTSSPAVDELETQLRELVRHQVGFSLIARGMYLRRLNDHVQAIRDQLSHDLAHTEAAVDHLMQELLREAEAEANADVYDVSPTG